MPDCSLSGCAGVSRVPRGQPQSVTAPGRKTAGVPRESRGLQPAVCIKMLLFGVAGSAKSQRSGMSE